MMLQFLCLIVFVKTVCCASVHDEKHIEVPSPFYEMPCMSFGGICLQKDDCPEGKQASVKGLCPLQQDKGVECCHSVARSAKTCRATGGECVPASWNCPNTLTVMRTTDCAKGETCCVMVH